MDGIRRSAYLPTCCTRHRGHHNPETKPTIGPRSGRAAANLVAPPPSPTTATPQTLKQPAVEVWDHRSAATPRRDAQPHATLLPGGAGPRQPLTSGRDPSPAAAGDCTASPCRALKRR